MGFEGHRPRAIVVMALVISGNASAQPSPQPIHKEAEARALFEHGVQLAEAERWSEAEKSFAKADALVPRASNAFNRALALYRLGRIREMLGELDRFLERSDPVTDARERSHAESLKQSGEGTLATLLIRVTPPNARLHVDAEVVTTSGSGVHSPIRVDPGDHVVTAELQGFEPGRVGVSVFAGEEAPVSITLTASPPAPSRPSVTTAATPATARGSSGTPLGPLVLTLTGTATLIAAGVTGVMALDLDARIAGGCSGEDSCFEDLDDDQERMETLAMTSTWLGVAGIALAGSGITWWLVAPGRYATPEVNAWLSPASAGVKGRF